MSQMKQQIQLLKNRPFAFFILSCLFSTMGSGLAYVAMTWLALRVHSTMSAVAILMICYWAPTVIIGPLAGVLADRYNKRVIIFLTTIARAIILISFAFYLTYDFSSFALYLSAVLVSLFFGLVWPTATAFVRELVSEDDLYLANTTSDIVYEFGNIVGMGSAGIIIALTSAQTALFINGVMYIIASFLIVFVRYKPHLIFKKVNFYRDFVEGLNYMSNKKSLFLLYLIQLLLMVSLMITPILLAPFAKNILHANVGQFGHIEADLSIGVVLGGLFTPYLAKKFGAKKILLIETILLVFCFAIFSQIHLVRSAEILYFFIGLCLASWPLIITKAQELTHKDYQGRVQSTFNSLAGIAILLAYAFITFFGKNLAINEWYWMEVLLATAVVYLVWRYK